MSPISSILIISTILMGVDLKVSAQTASAVTPAAPAAKATQAPKPARLADGKPNWTGFWVPVDGLLESYRGPSFLIKNPDDKPQSSSQWMPSPLKSPYKEKYEQGLKDLAAGIISYDPKALCLPAGMPSMMNMIYGMELLQTPGQVTITSEWQATSRRIWLDRVSHPDPEELDPTYAGDSIGHWEGDTLVVDTVGMRNDLRINSMGLPMSDKMHLTERFTQVRPGILEDVITLDDPAVFATPWKSTKTYRYRPDWRLREYVCEENNRNVGVNGQPAFPK